MKSIRRRLITDTMLIVLFSILCTSFPILKMESGNVRRHVTQLAEAKSSESSAEIDRFFCGPLSAVDSMAEYAKQYEVTYGTSEELFTGVVQANPDFLALYFGSSVPVAKGGSLIMGPAWTAPSDFDQTTRVWYKQAAASQQAVITEPYVDKQTGSLVTTLAKAVRRNGEVLGVIGLDITIDSLLPIVQGETVSASGKAYLLDADGLYITNEDAGKIMQRNFFDDYPAVAALKHAVLSQNESITLNAGGGMYMFSRRISGSGWIFVTTGPTRELFSEVMRNAIRVLLSTLLILFIADVVIFFIMGRIVHPIRQVVSAINVISGGNADLTRRIQIVSHDEVGNLVDGFNRFVAMLQGIVSKIKVSKNALGDIEADLQEQVQETAGSITQIISNIENVTGQMQGQRDAVEQTSAAITEIAENINGLDRMIEKQSAGVTEASAAVQQLLDGINSVNVSVEQMSQSFSSLQSHAESGAEQQQSVARQIVEVEEKSRSLHEANAAIASVASQTNLLAMNAAIEAAHAGEAGKGFSVVADEIRKLSETSSAQSKKISAELKGIQDTILSVVESAKLSTENFNVINEKIQQTGSLVSNIDNAMMEQRNGSGRIMDTLRLMNDSTQEVRSASKEMAAGNCQILAEIKNLQSSALIIQSSISEMSTGATHIRDAGKELSVISAKVNESFEKIGSEIDLFNT